MSSLRQYADRVLRLDLRSLALMRIGLGVVVLVDLAIRAIDLTFMYTDAGVFSRAGRVGIYGTRFFWSIYDLVAGSAIATGLVFGVTAVAAVALVLGIYTRAAVAVCWLSCVSLMTRMPLVSTGGDLLLAALLLWSLFLPLDGRYSLAARRRAEPPPEPANLASFAWMLQVSILFAFAGISKLADATWRAGEGVYYALTAEFYTTPVADALLDVSPGWVLVALTYAVIVYELLCPLLLVVPRRVPLLRGVFVVATAFMNLSFWACLRIGIFSWVAVIACLPLIPGAFWDWLERKLRCTPRPAPAQPARNLSKPVTIVLGVLIAIVVQSNLRLVDSLGFKRQSMIVVGQAGLRQHGWSLFAPTGRDQGWFLLLTRLRNNKVIDQYRGGAEPLTKRPSRISDEFRTYRQRKYYMNLRRNPLAARLLLLYYCRRWNRDHSGAEHAVIMSFVYMRDYTLPDRKRTPIERKVIATQRCD